MTRGEWAVTRADVTRVRWSDGGSQKKTIPLDAAAAAAAAGSITLRRSLISARSPCAHRHLRAQLTGQRPRKRRMACIGKAYNSKTCSDGHWIGLAPLWRGGLS